MKRFDDKWQECASQARVADSRSDEMPFGFANRVMARLQTNDPSPRTGDALWMQLSVRTLAAMSAALVLLAIIQWSARPKIDPLRPSIESTVVDYSNLL